MEIVEVILAAVWLVCLNVRDTKGGEYGVISLLPS